MRIGLRIFRVGHGFSYKETGISRNAPGPFGKRQGQRGAGREFVYIRNNGMILEYTFFQHALVGGLLACLLCAMVGTYVVTRRMVIAGGGMAHASLGGVGISAWMGLPPLPGAAVFAVATGLAIDRLARRDTVREDSAVAMLWTLGMSVGIMFAYLTPGFVTDLQTYLFGDILSITRADIAAVGALTLLTGLFFLGFRDSIAAVACDRDFAVTQGLPVRLLETVMTVLTALTIVASLHMVGIVLVVSLLAVPQMTAALFARTFGGMIAGAALAGYAACIGGLLLSYYCNVPGGASVILVSIMIFFVCRAIKALVVR